MPVECAISERYVGGLFERGNGYDPAELHPVFVDRGEIVERIIHDPSDPSYEFRTLADWESDFEARLEKARSEVGSDRRSHAETDRPPAEPGAPSVGFTTDKSTRIAEARKRNEEKRMKKNEEQLSRS